MAVLHIVSEKDGRFDKNALLGLYVSIAVFTAVHKRYKFVY